MIAGQLPGRTDTEIKNYWNTHIKRKLLDRGMDPHTHRPVVGAAQAAATSGLATAGYPSSPMPPSRHANPIFTVPSSSQSFARSSPSDDGHSSTGGSSSSDGPRCPDLNLDLDLDLSMSLPSSPPKTAPAAASTLKSQQQEQSICLCYHLGVRNGEAACTCKTASSPAGQRVFRFLRPLEEGQYI